MQLKYRPELDGLRAIACVAAILYHAEFYTDINGSNFQISSGGFFGVDIFFVISGYLIAHIILKKVHSNNFSFIEFFDRRARRILPTLFFVLGVSIFVAWFFMMPNQMKDFAGSSLSTLVYISNFWFLFEDSYLADISRLKPLLHTWSLAVEEQFYIMLPLFLFFIPTKFKNKTNIIIILIILISFIYSIIGSFKFIEANFYLLPSRLWELLAGSLIARNEIDNKIKFNNLTNSILSALGLLLILGSIIFIDDTASHPSFITILTVLGTAFILLSSSTNHIIKRILSIKALVWTGLISYSLYLWHFPILAFARIKSEPLSDFDKIEAVFLTFTLSIITYFLIEKPFRNFKFISSFVFLKLILISVVILFVTSVFIYITDGVPKRYPKTVLNLVDFTYDHKESMQENKCYIKLKNLRKKDIFKNCKVLNKKISKKNIYLWGDSNAAHLYSGLLHKYNESYNIFHKSGAACKPFFWTNDKCKKLNIFAFEEIIKLKPEKVFLSAWWLESDFDNIERIVNELRNRGVSNIYLVGASVRWSDSLPKLLLREFRYSRKIPKYLKDKNHIINFNLDKKLENLANNNSINYLSPFSVFCVKDKCLTKVSEEGDSIVTWDENHFTKKASIYLLSKFID